MDKIRLGNDIEMRWSIFTRDGDNKVPYNLEGRALTLSVVNRTGESEIEFFAEGNIVTGVFRGRDQRILGKHGVILRENNGKDGMRTIDACDAFELVACSCEEALGSSGTIQLFHLTFDSTIGAITGTIDPILNYEAEQAEAERKANEIIRKANEGQRIDNEKQRNVNEILRNTAEEERENAEQERIVNEDLRKADEAERKTNEESRLQSESDRVSSEEERLYAESIRVTNENARIASEAKRKEAETARIEAEDKRIVSEKNRLSAESSRIANEDSRRANEDSRLSAEAKRVSAEAKRDSAELERASAEEERQIAEEERQAKFASMVVQTIGDATDKVMSQKSVTEALKGKQNKLTAGKGISIDGDVISATLDMDIVRVVDALPSVGEANLIYLVPAEQPSESDLFEEWVWTDKWERIGSAKMDLSNYATKGYVDTKISSTEETLVHKDGFERITGRKQFQNGISVGLFNALVANDDRVESGAWLDQNENPAPFIVADPSADGHAATKLYVDEGLATKQGTLTAGNGISIEGGVIGVTEEISSKQDPIADLEEIRSNATNGNEAAEAVRQMNTDLIYKHRTMVEAMASIEARLAALESSRGLLGEATAGRLDVTELTTYLYPRVLYGHGVPSASVIPDNLPEGLPWDGVPVFIGQQYINLDATSAGLYYAKGHDSVSDWKQA